MISDYAEYFREWLALFHEDLFMILRVYADESGTSDPSGQQARCTALRERVP